LEELVQSRTEELRRSEEKIRSIFSASPSAVTATDLQGTIVECNEETLRLHGFSSKGELIGKSALQLIAEKDHQKAIKNLKKALEQGTLNNVEYTYVTKDGREFPAELSASVIRDGSGKPVGFVAISEDIAERKNMEQQLVVSKKMAAIGELAGMVGHDLRNPLTSIRAATYYLRAKHKQKLPKKGREMLEIIESGVEYSNKIINDLLDYSREIKLELAETSPRSMIQKALSLANIPKNIQVIDSSENETIIAVDVEKMERVFINIIGNAVDAMPKGGTLAIRSSKSDKHVEFSFSDTGIGMSKETLDRIGAPLYTTKARGMGFGLAICKRIVEGHGGSMTANSCIGKGSTFRITIPVKPKLDKTEISPIDLSESVQRVKEA
jgi:two-component system NtrC family sensor kinase